MSLENHRVHLGNSFRVQSKEKKILKLTIKEWMLITVVTRSFVTLSLRVRWIWVGSIIVA